MCVVVAVAERPRRNASLHLTNIRNENAYYCCIAQILPFHLNGVSSLDMRARGLPVLPELPSKPALALPPRSTVEPLYICGESLYVDVVLCDVVLLM